MLDGEVNVEVVCVAVGHAAPAEDQLWTSGWQHDFGDGAEGTSVSGPGRMLVD